jgi:hypothetical protein
MRVDLMKTALKGRTISYFGSRDVVFSADDMLVCYDK